MQYICTHPIGKYEKDEIINGHAYRKKLSESEKLYFKEYVPEETKSFAEQLADNIREDDKADH